MAEPSMDVRFLRPGEEPLAEAFLAAQADTTMILRSNLSRAGLANEGRMYQGAYAGAFAEEVLVGLAALYWNANLVVAGGAHVVALARALAELAADEGRAIRGILGPAPEAFEAQRVVDERFGRKLRMSSREILYALTLADLVVPESLTRFDAGKANGDDAALLLDWRMAFSAESLSLPDTTEERRRQAPFLRELIAQGNVTILRDAGAPVATSSFNATVADMVQVGGVFTPPALRGRGYARCVVAASLEIARSRGAERAILFTQESNVAAQRAYAPLGFRSIGDYAIVVFD